MSFKKFITLLLSLLMVISMTACSGGGGGETPEPSGETKYKTTLTYAVGGEPTYMDLPSAVTPLLLKSTMRSGIRCST